MWDTEIIQKVLMNIFKIYKLIWFLKLDQKQIANEKIETKIEKWLETYLDLP